MATYAEFVRALLKQDGPRMMKSHAAMGIAGEAGELCDAIKKDIHYGQEPDLENILEEVGDCLFYLQAVCGLYGLIITEALEKNTEKLAKRYASLSFTTEESVARKDKAGE